MRKQTKNYEFIEWGDLERAAETFKRTGGATGTDWDAFRGKYLRLPDWLDHSLDPLSSEYKAQQDRIWQMMVGENTSYDPSRDELTGDAHIDVLKAPGLYSGDISRAGEHLMAMGHLIKVSGLRRGDRVLEYGAGFGQIALAMARMGVIVDTIDIDATFCKAVQAQAEWFGVELKSHIGRFGDNPTGKKYNVILFYEAFHHSRDFIDLVTKLRDMLAPGGRILMAGEPVLPSTNEDFKMAVPYPWGLRLEAEVAAIVRWRRWYELGFQEEFLFKFFSLMGFGTRKYDCHLTGYARIYEFSPRPDIICLSKCYLPPDIDLQWHGVETEGRWTKSYSTIPLDPTPSWSKLNVVCQNFHGRYQLVKFEMGKRSFKKRFKKGELITITLDRDELSKELRIQVKPINPRSYGVNDNRQLGIFVKRIEYSF